MLDVFIKKIIIHQFTPDDTELILADKCVQITPRIDDYFRKKLAKVFSDDAKRGQFQPDNDFLSHLSDDFIESSKSIANLWKEEFVISEDQKTNDLVFLQFDKKGRPTLLFFELV